MELIKTCLPTSQNIDYIFKIPFFAVTLSKIVR